MADMLIVQSSCYQLIIAIFVFKKQTIENSNDSMSKSGSVLVIINTHKARCELKGANDSSSETREPSLFYFERFGRELRSQVSVSVIIRVYVLKLPVHHAICCSVVGKHVN